jgi:hypothetical protein
MKTRVIVSSESRDHGLFPEPSEYEAVFPYTFKNVNSVSLIAATLPQKDKVISSRRDTIFVSVNGTTKPVTLARATPPNAAALAESLQSALKAAFPGNEFVVTAVNDKIHVALPTSFAIIERGDLGLYRTLGLASGDNFSFVDTVATAYVIEAAYEANLSRDSVSILSIAGMEVVTSNGTVTDRAFAVLPSYHMHKSLPVCYHPVRPIAKLPKMKISLVRADGTPCDFQGQDHFLHFEVDHGAKAPAPTDVVVEVISKHD